MMGSYLILLRYGEKESNNMTIKDFEQYQGEAIASLTLAIKKHKGNLEITKSEDFFLLRGKFVCRKKGSRR